MEVLAYLELPAGTHQFGIRCDDGYKLTSGSSLNDTATTPLAFHNGGPADETVDFLVSQPGLYPFRMVWYEQSGGAFVEWFSLDPGTGTRTLINDPNNPDAIKAYTSVTAAAPELLLEYKAKLTDAFAVESTASIDSAAKAITVPMSGPTGFFRLRYSGTAISLTGFTVTGSNLTIRYTTTP